MRLLERSQALDCFAHLLADADAGRGRVLLVTGAMATGKSVLLHALRDLAGPAGFVAVEATASSGDPDLPWAVVAQLLHGAPLTAAERARAAGLLAAGSEDRRAVPRLCQLLLDLTDRHPLVLVVDDLQHADPDSLRLLGYLARRVKSARLLLALAELEPGRRAEDLVGADVLRRPHCRKIRVGPLSPDGAAALAREVVGAATADRLRGHWFTLSGGNPLLVKALAEDCRDAMAAGRGGAPDGAVVAERYARAVLCSIRRGDPHVAQVAEAVAVLGSTRCLEGLLPLPPGHLARALRLLTAAGVLSADGFRHEVGRAAVLAEMEPGAHSSLRLAAAAAAYRSGVGSSVVAEHLRQSRQAPPRWALPVLMDAARQALRAGDPLTAAAHLRLHNGHDERTYKQRKTLLIQAEWRVNPTVPLPSLVELAATVHHGGLPVGAWPVLLSGLLWHGRFADARQVLSALRAATGADAVEVALVRKLLRCTYPTLDEADLDRAAAPGQLPAPAGLSRIDIRWTKAGEVLTKVLSDGPGETLAADVDHILRAVRLDDLSFDAVEWSLRALSYGDRLEYAVSWCDTISAAARTAGAPAWCARVAAVRADIAIRQGDVRGARQYARNALDLLPPSGWGVALADPVSSLVLANTAMGRHDLAAQQLALPLPAETFQTRHGLQYLYARGRYNLAIDEPGAALADFGLCGELADAWGMGAPGFVPWRVYAAEACLRMGLAAQARELVESHLARCSPSALRARGLATRLLPGRGGPQRRVQLARRAAQLHAASDQYEMARALYDVAEAHRVAGRYRRAAAVAARAAGRYRRAAAVAARAAGGYRRAATVAARAAQVPGQRRPLPAGDASPVRAPEPPAAATGTTEPAAVLSEAERRVAELAAVGYTNREIAEKLWITVSTVEQHLTRTYRKLEVTRRSELPAGLAMGRSGTG